MSKAILVIDDMPSCCDYCPFGSENDLGICECLFKAGTVDSKIFYNRRGDWCPLKEIPEKKKINAKEGATRSAQKDGWNNCIDEILKENKCQ